MKLYLSGVEIVLVVLVAAALGATLDGDHAHESEFWWCMICGGLKSDMEKTESNDEIPE